MFLCDDCFLHCDELEKALLCDDCFLRLFPPNAAVSVSKGFEADSSSKASFPDEEDFVSEVVKRKLKRMRRVWLSS